MTTSPAWLTIALTTLSSTSSSPATVLNSGIRPLPSPHILHHLNRWARHVWRPSVAPRALSDLTQTPSRTLLLALGPGPIALLIALFDAITRCRVEQWLDVLGVMFLADDPYAVEVGRSAGSQDADRASSAMRALFANPGMLIEVANESEGEMSGVGVHELEDSHSGDAFAELRSRVATLQLQLDDVTAVVRRNEQHTKDMLSSFHFWSMLLLDELRSYRSRERGEHDGGEVRRNTGSDVVSNRVGALHVRPEKSSGGKGGCHSRYTTERDDGTRGGNICMTGNVDDIEKPRLRRVFRDGRWVEL